MEMDEVRRLVKEWLHAHHPGTKHTIQVVDWLWKGESRYTLTLGDSQGSLSKRRWLNTARIRFLYHPERGIYDISDDGCNCRTSLTIHKVVAAEMLAYLQTLQRKETV